MADQIDISNVPASIDRLSAEDFETASIRSAAPSYTSEAPSYHSTFPGSEPIPTYAPPAPAPASTSAAANGIGNPASAPSDPPASSHARQNSLPTLLPSSAATAPTIGLPPAPRRASDPPPGVLRIAPWSQLNANPTARHYQSVARRRVAAASSSASGWGDLGRSTLERVAEEDAKVRPLEDPYLVGEEAAKRARAERLARENGDDVLYREDRRWDWFLAQMKDWEEREKSWTQFRRSLETNSRGKLARRLGALR